MHLIRTRKITVATYCTVQCTVHVKSRVQWYSTADYSKACVCVCVCTFVVVMHRWTVVDVALILDQNVQLASFFFEQQRELTVTAQETYSHSARAHAHAHAQTRVEFDEFTWYWYYARTTRIQASA